MSAVDLARSQFARTSIGHFLFLPVTIGLALLTAVLQTRWYRTGQPGHLRLTSSRLGPDLLREVANAGHGHDGGWAEVAPPSGRPGFAPHRYRNFDVRTVGPVRCVAVRVAGRATDGAPFRSDEPDRRRREGRRALAWVGHGPLR